MMSDRSRMRSTPQSPAVGEDHRNEHTDSWVDDAGRVVLIAAVLGWLTIISLIIRQRIFVSHDSLISYAHSWWIESRLWHGHGIPWRMPVLGHGQALTYPYGFLPWTVAALLWPLTGERSVTLVLVLGAVGLIAATFWAFPETRRPWYAAGVLVNPILVVAPISGQVPFLWASTLFVLGVGCWRRDRRLWAVLLAGLGQLCHPAVVLPIAAVFVLARLRWEPDRRGLLRCYALSVCVAVPGIWAVLHSPVFADSSWQTRIVQFVETVLIRACVFVPPLVVFLLLRYPRRSLAPVLVGVTLLLNVVLIRPLDASYSWGALRREPDQTMLAFVATSEFRPGAMYRVLPSGDGRVGMYELIRHGGRLDSEFFPESIWFGNYVDERAYSDFLTGRGVDYVLIFRNPDDRQPTNEGELINRLATSGRGCVDGLVGVRLVQHNDRWDDFKIDRSCRPHARRGPQRGASP
jgi:hypothetical protein